MFMFLLHRIFYTLDLIVDAWWKISRVLHGPIRHAQIIPFRSFGSRSQLFIHGRVLSNRPLRPEPSDSAARSFWMMLSRWASRELPGLLVLAKIGRVEASTVTDEEGYFRFVLEYGTSCPEEPWQQVVITLPGVVDAAPEVARVLSPISRSQYGVISDIDDTITYSAATNLWRMLRIVLFGTSFTRLPFPGVAAFYRGLEKGTTGEPINPIFYVSSSPWNLYDVLRGLFEHRSIPAGPLLLQDFGVDAKKFIHASHRDHKLQSIRGVLLAFEDLKFILIGDSGQQDPEIYREVIQEFPGRVLGVYIRDVSSEPSRDSAVQTLAEELASQSCPLLLAEETFSLAEDAERRGWIGPEVLLEIRAEQQAELAGTVTK